MVMPRIYTALVVSLFVSLPPAVAIAQDAPVLFVVDPLATIEITAAPQYPGPHEDVRLTIHGGSLANTKTNPVTWMVDDKVVAQGIGRDNITVTTGALGSRTTVTARVPTSDGDFQETTITLTPTHIDLLVDTSGYTPPFYHGRALPSPGTQLLLQATAYFRRADGSSMPPSEIIYTWKKNGQVFGTASGKGRQTATLPAPALFGTETVSVEAVAANGSLRGSASIRLQSIDPILALYEDSPLFGILFHKAIGQNDSINDSEATFVAVPYFAQAEAGTDPRLRYDWTVSGVRIPTNAAHPDRVTINADSSSGATVINLSLSHTQNVFTSSKGRWGVTFHGSGQSSNPLNFAF